MLTDRTRFGPFEVDWKAGELRRDGVLVPVQDLPFRLLAALLEHPGQVLTRAELTARLWGTETFVDAAAGLNTAVAKLREALGDDADRPLYIETLPKRGYRFIGELGELLGPPAHESERRSPRRRRTAAWLTAALAAIAVAELVVYQLRADRPQMRIAVILFDNETGRPELGRLAQGLTDATVFELTAQRGLAVIGNASILRTPRPFRDIGTVRDALHADFIVIGQVQTIDGEVLARAHLIRAKDQAHVWVDAIKMAPGDEAGLQSAVAGRVARAVSTHVNSVH
jgi:DNA-binding winged helix-turn-helix (wHTH) protein